MQFNYEKNQTPLALDEDEASEWAGIFRRSEKNIGIDWKLISTEVNLTKWAAVLIYYY